MLLSYTSCLERYGNHHRIAEMVRRGVLSKIEPGLYSDGAFHHEVEVLQAKYPKSVVTMLSAYYYYDLTDNVPDRYHLAMERGGTKIRDARVLEYFVPSGTLEIGVVHTNLQGIPLRIFDRERLLVETVRMRTKLPYDLYREVIGGFRRLVTELYPAKMSDYIEMFPKRDMLDRIIRSEVF